MAEIAAKKCDGGEGLPGEDKAGIREAYDS